MQSPEISNKNQKDKQTPSETEPSSVNPPSNYSSNDLVSPPLSEIEANPSEQDIQALFGKNPKFHKDNRDLDLGSDLYSEALSPNRSNPSISTNFFKQRAPRRNSPVISDSLPLSQLNFQSMENTRLTNPLIQGKVEDLIRSIKTAQKLKTEKPSLLQRQKLFDRLLIEEIEAGYLKKQLIPSDPVMPRIVKFEKNNSEYMISDIQPKGEADKKKSTSKQPTFGLISQKYQDKNFPGILCSLIDNVQEPDFGSLARLNFSRLGDILSPFLRNNRIRPLGSKLHFSCLWKIN